jgi:hypothetical protein
MNEVVRVKPKAQWRTQKVRDARRVERMPGKPQAMSGAIPREKPCVLQMARL